MAKNIEEYVNKIIYRSKSGKMDGYAKTNQNGKQVRLHRYLMEKHIRRALKSNELVHHVDGDKNNNNINNLKIVTRAEHNRIHKNGENTQFKDKYQISQEDIIRLYHKEKNPIHTVAKILGATYGAVLRRMERYGIPRRKQGPITN